MSAKDDLIVYAVLAAVAVAGVWYLKKKVAAAAADAGKQISEAVDTAWEAAMAPINAVVPGVVYGVGDAIGVPRTSMTECERAMAEGRTLDASFACPALDFFKYMAR